MIRIGTAGWSYADWEGVVYPRKKPRGFHALPYLARFVDCVEINSSFYATPRADYAERWAELVEDRPHFRFTAKLQDLFTHRRLEPTQRAMEAERFRAGLQPLRSAGKLAALLVQFPFSFRRTSAAEERLAWIADTFAGDQPLVLEVRHRSWFEPESLERLARLSYSLATIDLPAHKDHPPAEVEPGGPIGYLRIHGRNSAAWFEPKAGRDDRYDYLYSEDEVRALAQSARRLATGTDETYVITNNHFAGKAVANALELRYELEGEAPPAPPELVQKYPRLKGKTRGATSGGSTQGTLFADGEEGV